MKARSKRRNGQTMVEYIIIVALVAVGLIALFGYFSKAVGTKVSGVTSALDDGVGKDAQGEVDKLDGGRIRTFNADGTFN
jgi:Flp pilus assembly pilin Flp